MTTIKIIAAELNLSNLELEAPGWLLKAAEVYEQGYISKGELSYHIKEFYSK